MTADDCSSSAVAEKASPAQASLMDVETPTSATEFCLTVNDWLAGIVAKETQAAGFNLEAWTALFHNYAVD